jgi:hypothetical protein
MQKITFTDTQGVPDEFCPKPATASVPDWYKSLESYMSGDKKPDGQGMTTATIKRCMPVFDAIVSGYILYTYVDVFVSQKKILYGDKAYFEETGEERPLTDEQIKEKGLPINAPYYEWPTFNPIQFHPHVQAPEIPAKGNKPESVSYPKWINPWSISTPKGYSVLFTQPMHRESPFTILDAIVDTDSYNAPVNFPFVLNDWGFEGLIPAGTPMAQVIPFKRESWQMDIGKSEEYQAQQKTTVHLRTSFFDSYKNKFRQPKEYK